MIFPLLSAISESFATLVDKLNLNIKKMDGRAFTAVLFVFMGLFSLPLLCFSGVNPGAFGIYPIIVMSLIILGSALQNVLFYIGLSNRNLSSLEPIRNSEPILIILLAFLFFPSERNVLVLVLGAITTLALVFAHLDRKERKSMRIAFDKYSMVVLLSMLVSAFLAIGYKLVLEYYSPVSLYAVRAIGVAVVLSMAYRPKIRQVGNRNLLMFAVAALLYSGAAIFQYYAIAQVGISTTVLILTLSPVIIYMFSRIMLKERLTANKIISSIVIVSCVAVAYFLL